MSEDLNLSCKSVQHRLATQWGYVKAEEVAAEREACAVLCENFCRNGNWITKEEAAKAIRARGVVHASDTNQERVDEMAKDRHEWVGLTDGDIAQTMHGSVEGSNVLPYQFARAIEAKLKEKNHG